MKYNLINFCENDVFAVKSYCAIHNETEVRNLGDVTKIDIEILSKCDIVTHGSPCFTGDTLILTDKGYIPILDIKVGYKVLTHKNDWQPVIKFIEQGEKEIWELKTSSTHKIKTTQNHKFLAREKYRYWDNNKRVYLRKFKEANWVETKDLTQNHFIGYAINTKSVIPDWEGTMYNHNRISNNLDMADPDLWYLVGRYLGNGWVRNRPNRNCNYSSVIICCGKHKAKNFETKISNKFHYSKVEQRTVFRYQFSNKEFANFIKDFGTGAKNKFIPQKALDLPINLLRKLIEGYLDSDGYSKNNTYSITSISKKLLYGIEQCVAKVYHISCNMYEIKVAPTKHIEERLVNQQTQYKLTFKLNVKTHSFYENGYIWTPVKSVKNTNTKELTYDITVENNHSFTANGLIAHNCQDFSVAGLQKGGDENTGNRSSLIWNSVKIIEQCQPKFVIWVTKQLLYIYK